MIRLKVGVPHTFTRMRSDKRTKTHTQYIHDLRRPPSTPTKPFARDARTHTRHARCRVRWAQTSVQSIQICTFLNITGTSPKALTNLLPQIIDRTLFRRPRARAARPGSAMLRQRARAARRCRPRASPWRRRRRRRRPPSPRRAG
jgi:hypothetical protein